MFGHVQKRETLELTGRRKREMPHRKFMDAVKEDTQRLVVKGKACFGLQKGTAFCWFV